MQLRQFIPQEFCLQCDVCCRFSQEHTVWAPMFMESEMAYLVEKNILPPLSFSTALNDKNAQSKNAHPINLVEHNDYFICPCFNPVDHRCKIYSNRPFECRLYPFLLVRQDNKFFLAQDKKCPYIDNCRGDEIKGHIVYLEKEFLKTGTLSFLEQNRELFGQYPGTDITVLFPIKIS